MAVVKNLVTITKMPVETTIWMIILRCKVIRVKSLDGPPKNKCIIAIETYTVKTYDRFNGFITPQFIFMDMSIVVLGRREFVQILF